jgi:hypothetical protein
MRLFSYGIDATRWIIPKVTHRLLRLMKQHARRLLIHCFSFYHAARTESDKARCFGWRRPGVGKSSGRQRGADAISGALICVKAAGEATC